MPAEGEAAVQAGAQIRLLYAFDEALSKADRDLMARYIWREHLSR